MSVSRPGTPLDLAGYVSMRWEHLLQFCKENLGTEYPNYLGRTPTRDVLLQKLGCLHLAPYLIDNLESPLKVFEAFTGWLTSALNTIDIGTSIFWDITSLVIEAAAEKEHYLPDVLEMLKDLGHELDVFQQCEIPSQNTSSIGLFLFNTFLDVVTFWCGAIKVLRHCKQDDPDQQRYSGQPPSNDQNKWLKLQNQFNILASRIRKQSQRRKEKTELLTTAELLKYLSAHKPISPNTTDRSELPRHNIQTPRNTYFFGRSGILTRLRDHLIGGPSGMKSYTLWGIGGAGKTRIALELAYQILDTTDYTVLWVDAESWLSLARSFRDIATTFEISDRRENETSDRNIHVVLNWLRVSCHNWLLIIDNAENENLLGQTWPVAPSGSVLVTSRDRYFSVKAASDGEEVPVFNKEDGACMLKELVAREKYSDEDDDAATLLSIKMQGLPLALRLAAIQIGLRGMSIAAFNELHDQHSQILRGENQGMQENYKHSLDTCWLTAFENLPETAKDLLGMCAMFAPDNIPEDLFNANQSDNLNGMAFYRDQLTFETAILPLLKSSLLQRQPATRTLSVHRLIQEEFLRHLPAPVRRNLFENCIRFLQLQLPPYNNGRSFRNDFPKFHRYIEHDENSHLISLLCSAGWYLMEVGAWLQHEEIMQFALQLCHDRRSITHSNLLTCCGCMEVERGHTHASVLDQLKQAQDIRIEKLPQQHLEVANSKGNYANAILQRGDPSATQEALDLYIDALKTNDAVSKYHPEEGNSLLHIRHFALAKAFRVLKQYNEATYHGEQARKYSLASFGPRNHFVATSMIPRSQTYIRADYYIGNIHWDQGNIDEAEICWKRAHDVMEEEDDKHPSTSAARLKLAWVALRRGNVEEAITSLERLILVAKLNEKKKRDRGEIARYMRTMADAYRQNDDEGKFREFRDTAERYRWEIQKERFADLPDTDQSYCLMSFSAFW